MLPHLVVSLGMATLEYLSWVLISATASFTTFIREQHTLRG